MFKSMLQMLFDPNKDGRTTPGEFFGGVIKLLIGGAVWAWFASLSYDLLSAVFPNNVFSQYVGLLLFDLGVPYWLYQFRSVAKGTYQRVISVTMTLWSLLGLLLVIVIESLIGGNELIANIDVVLVGKIATGTVIVWAIAFAIAFVVYEITDEQTIKDILFKLQQDKVATKAIQKTNDNIDSLAESLSDGVSVDMTKEFKDVYRKTQPKHEQNGQREKSPKERTRQTRR